ncbi:MAG: V-type ATP synthase subunit F [Eubacterium sp.]|nr:V-type ATP synthase subunit F [Eubacterium sp.]MBR1773725.1 V-type ATP synthase subunit F [Eubacterium sp.]MEE3399876.1 V-type ATP synthase subunit F [Eubacterium sp.]
MDENRIAVIGDYDSIYGFASLGLSTFPVDGEEDAVKTLKNLASSGYGIIYITEELAAVTAKQIQKYKEEMTPAIIQIPGVKGNTGDGIMAVRRSVEQAVGSDILFGE